MKILDEENTSSFIHETICETDWIYSSDYKFIERIDMSDGCKLYAVPNPALITPRLLISLTDIESLVRAILTWNFSGGGICRMLVTTDLKIYKTYQNGEWQIVDHTNKEEIENNGIVGSAIEQIPNKVWNDLLSSEHCIGFAYLPTIKTVSDVCKVDQLTLSVDMRGRWDSF